MRKCLQTKGMMGRASRDTWSADSVDPTTVQRLEGTIMNYMLNEYDQDQKSVSRGEGEASQSRRHRRFAPKVLPIA